MNIDELHRQYLDDGWVLIPGVLAARELQSLQATTDRIAALAAELTQDNEVLDLEEGHTPQAPLVQRIKKPHRVDPLYFELARHPHLFALVQRICGPDVRLNHSKINMKAAHAGAALEWHQDWAFAPHTNMSTCVASVLIDDVGEDNGPMQVLPGSHLGPLHDHHDPERGFVGAVDIAALGLDLSSAQGLVGPAGSVTLHHPMMLHGSAPNRSGRQRRILFLEYAASDAFPLFYPVDWDEYESRRLSGPPTSLVRIEPHVVKLPYPSPRGSSIYKAQAQARSRFFGKAA